MLSSSTGLERSETSTCRFNAKDVALLTRPSISAPLKFLVLATQHKPGQSLHKKVQRHLTLACCLSKCSTLGSGLACQRCKVDISADEGVLHHFASMDLHHKRCLSIPDCSTALPQMLAVQSSSRYQPCIFGSQSCQPHECQHHLEPSMQQSQTACQQLVASFSQSYSTAHRQDLNTAALIGKANFNLDLQTARPQQCLIKHVLPVSHANEQYIVQRIHTINLGEKLIHHSVMDACT